MLTCVHCRTGSLEKYIRDEDHADAVHCRTGSLEIDTPRLTPNRSVHCRTGSLEKPDAPGRKG